MFSTFQVSWSFDRLHRPHLSTDFEHHSDQTRLSLLRLLACFFIATFLLRHGHLLWFSLFSFV